MQEPEGRLLSTIYNIGQLVPCIVLKLDDDKKDKGKRKLWLSLRLSLLYKSLTLDTIQDGMVRHYLILLSSFRVLSHI